MAFCDLVPDACKNHNGGARACIVDCDVRISGVERIIRSFSSTKVERSLAYGGEIFNEKHRPFMFFSSQEAFRALVRD